jgi:cysteine-rich repeat protein
MVVYRGVNVVLALALTSGLVACVAPLGGDEPPAVRGRAPIIGGSEEWGFPLVGTLAGDMGPGSLYPFCTATPVTPTVIVTAAHCTDAFSQVGNVVVLALLNPDGTGATYSVIAASRRNHPSWDPYGYGYVNDIAVVELNDAIDADIFPAQHRSQFGGGDVGTTLKVVGYGVNVAPDQGAGTKRSISMRVSDALGQYFVMVNDVYSSGVCYGDSGGPSFVEGAFRDTQVGVHARTQIESCGPAEDTDVGFFYASFLRSAVLNLDPGAETCGDAVCTGLESDTECPADCSPYECGDGTAEGPEVCDDGNTAGGDGCSADCLSDETCGNGVTDGPAGEACDDGNAVSGDGCSADCRSNETCGNGIADGAAGEVCDDGNTAGGDGCSSDCFSDESCGNGTIDDAAGEVCDDGNAVGGDGCSGDCRSNETCGNGVADLSVGEACDDGNTTSGDGCSGDCRVAEGCGNGELETRFGEVCDDGNQRDGDGCAANCRSDERCGNGVVDSPIGETCDDGNELDGDACPSDCGAPMLFGLPGLQGGCGCRASATLPARAIGALLAI